jgi:hypothetical protein
MQTRITVRQTKQAGTEQESSVERLITQKDDQPYTREAFAASITAAIAAANVADGPVTAIHAFARGV